MLIAVFYFTYILISLALVVSSVIIVSSIVKASSFIIDNSFIKTIAFVVIYGLIEAKDIILYKLNNLWLGKSTIK